MSIQIVIHDGPLPRFNETYASPVGAGAILLFEGVVRPLEDERELKALEYEVYEPMASRELHKLTESMVQLHGLMGIHVEHSRGRVHVGETSFRLRIMSRHRKEGIAATDQFIDRMKKDVPVWKVPIWK